MYELQCKFYSEDDLEHPYGFEYFESGVVNVLPPVRLCFSMLIEFLRL